MENQARPSKNADIPREAPWWGLQRLTAVALVPFCLWFVYQMLWLVHHPVDTVRAWLAQPSHAIAVVVFMMISIIHSYLGLRVIFQDYVPCTAARKALYGISIILLGGAALLTVLSLGRSFLQQA